MTTFLPPPHLPLPPRRVHHRPPQCNTNPPKRPRPRLSRRAFIALLTTLPLQANALEELLDQDLDLDTAGSPHAASRYGWVDGASQFTEATDEDYMNAMHVDSDVGRTAQVYAARAGVVGFVAAFSAVAMSISERESLRTKLPVVYDPEVLERYFKIRPDKVIKRLCLFAKEIGGYSMRLASDLFAERVADAFAVRRGARSRAWMRARAQARDERRAVLLREAIIRLGPAVIKLGQAAASRPDLFGVAAIRELQKLQDNILEVFPAREAYQLIYEELGAKPSAIFENLSPSPVAGASLGMVFKAEVEGVPVAVKVQRPEVAESMALDCYIVRGLAAFATVVLGSRTDFRGAVDEYSSRLFEELDYRNELGNLEKFRELYGGLRDIYLPRAFSQYCSRKVLVTEWVEGVKLIDEMARVRTEDLQVVETGIKFALTQLLDKGLLHADMHNGNMLRTKSGYLAFIDFGLVAEVPKPVRQSLVCALMHLIHGEYTRLAECFAGMSLMSSEDIETDLPLLSEALRETFEPANEALAACRKTGVNRFNDFTLVGAVSKLLTLGPRFPFVFNDYFLNNLRCLGMLEGLALNADPNFNVLGVVYPYVIKKILSDPAPRYQRALESLVIDSYGRMRWSRMDQLLQDVEDTAATSILGSAEQSTALGFSKTLPSEKAEPRRRAKRRQFSKQAFDEEHSPALVIRFITSKSGRFVRQYIIQRYITNMEAKWQKRIDKLTRNTPKQPPENESHYEALHRVALQATARELSDDEARIRTRQFFRRTPLSQRFRVLFGLAPGFVVPMIQLIFRLVAYLVKALFAYRTKKRVAVAATLKRSADVESVERWSIGNRKEGDQWTPFDSAFLRRTQEARLAARPGQSAE